MYSRGENREAFDCVVTSFFIDTAHNVLEYLEVIFSVLKPGLLKTQKRISPFDRWIVDQCWTVALSLGRFLRGR